MRMVNMKKRIITFIAKNTFLCALSLLLCGIIIVHNCYRISWLFGIGQSIIASFFFYLMLEYFPMRNKDYQNVKADAVLYRHLQLLLVRLDDIFICPHKVLKSETERVYSMSVEEFYSKEFQLEVMNDFNLNSFVQNSIDNKPITYREYIYFCWNGIKQYAHLIINNNRIYDNTDLYYEIDHLLNETMLARLLNNTSILSCINCNDICYLLYPEDVNGNINDSFEKHLIKIHQLAFDMYDNIHKYDLDNVYEPMFYNRKN